MRFRDRWLRRKKFAWKKHACKRRNPRIATKLTGDLVKKSYSVGHLMAILAERGKGV